jgi:hypothetical protein
MEELIINDPLIFILMYYDTFNPYVWASMHSLCKNDNDADDFIIAEQLNWAYS